MALGGAAAGFLASTWLFGYLRSLLYGVEPFDPLTYAVVFGGILAVAAAASVMPALRAARSEILSALR
jgi:ABC-type lipoprotein release transport system permease subunit